jgi:hypothetical protein
MQNFQNTVNQSVWAFENDVVVTEINGVYSFATASGVPLTTIPTTLVPYTIPAPTDAQLLSAAQTKQVATNTSAAAASMVSGYTSSALGSAYTYPSKTTDQINMLGSVSSSLLPGLASTWTTPFWCAPVATGVWAYQNHTAAQIQQVGADGKAWIVSNQTQLAELNAQVAAATTVAAVQAIVWTPVT